MRRALALGVLCALAAHAHAGSDAGIVSPVPFTFAARYGRSPPRHIAPRNDRWMMTTRYGKRSDAEALPPDAPPARGERRPPCRRVLALYLCTRSGARAHSLARLAWRSAERH